MAKSTSWSNTKQKEEQKKASQPCPKCGEPIGVLAGSQDAICRNCGFKDPCCE